jgi:hypothetical protein
MKILLYFMLGNCLTFWICEQLGYIRYKLYGGTVPHDAFMVDIILMIGIGSLAGLIITINLLEDFTSWMKEEDVIEEVNK